MHALFHLAPTRDSFIWRQTRTLSCGITQTVTEHCKRILSRGVSWTLLRGISWNLSRGRGLNVVTFTDFIMRRHTCYIYIHCLNAPHAERTRLRGISGFYQVAFHGLFCVAQNKLRSFGPVHRIFHAALYITSFP